MLITFKSKAAADVLMYAENAKPILDLLGKDLQRGVITAAESAGAVAKLEQQVALANSRDAESASADDKTDDDAPAASHVRFATRIYPLLEMLKAAQQDQVDVMWGV